MFSLPALSALLAATLSLELVAVNAHGPNGHHHAHRGLHKRQSDVVAAAAASSASTSGATTATVIVTASSAAATSVASTTSAAAAGAVSGTTSGVAPAGSAASTTSGAAAPAASSADIGTGVYDIPPLASITMGMPSGPLPSLTTTYTPGASPTYLSGAPPLPTKFVFSSADWPELDKIPPTDSDQVKEWMKELDGHDIPDITPTQDGSCAGDPAAAAQAQERGWWTCGGWTSGNDIVSCPDKMTWGVSFDDGPAPYSEKLLKYLDEKDLSATFFVVGSRVVSYPDILIAEYMAGHEIAVHTWSHHPLTAMSNEQIVAELGWTRHAIQQVLGVTPTTMRAPFGDIDNRVRAISNAMGLRPIIWTTGPGGPFDTNDWHVPAGTVTGEQQFEIFQNLLGNATIMDTGFIVLEHDLFEITVDLAVGYTLNAALTHNPPFKLESIGQCLSMPAGDLYVETNTNTSISSGQHSSSAAADGSADSNGSPHAFATSALASVLSVVAVLLVGLV
ncbi:carbohydrate esterase family 4 protein [Trametes coccinea BRFM310]|uniref:chitin deacetylase n=1 Tax=Trametes coccinea (strain BRFM310) TaxID=1353009 RepID=A0A1Y2IUE9_TRAC3|nr:carbohydrate esterase family 4 protein [Trametes coccinea BRFM310]